MTAPTRLARLRSELASRAVQIVTAALLLWSPGQVADWLLRILAPGGLRLSRFPCVAGYNRPWSDTVGVPHGALVLLFNPIYPIHFKRGTWVWLDVLAALLFLACPPNREVRHDRN